MTYDELAKAPNLDKDTLYYLASQIRGDPFVFVKTELHYVIQGEDAWQAMPEPKTYDLPHDQWIRCANGADDGVLWAFKDINDAIYFKLTWC
jgi:hypothetical protein